MHVRADLCLPKEITKIKGEIQMKNKKRNYTCGISNNNNCNANISRGNSNCCNKWRAI